MITFAQTFEMDIKKLIESVNHIAIEAGEKIMEIYNTGDFNVEAKSDDSPLTIADKAANDIICAGLEALDIKLPIISEENKAISYDERKDFDYCWMVDPLDGTKEFIKKNGEFTVNIALIKDQKSVAGVVYVPASKTLFYAYEGGGAWRGLNEEKTQLQANKFSMEDKGIRVVCSRSHLNDSTKEFLDALDGPETVSKGSSLKFLIIAEGNAEVYPRLAPTMEWDTAAAHIILKEAGGSVNRAEDGSELKYNKENLLNPFFIAAGKN